MLYINNISKGRSLCKLTIPQMEEILERWIIHRLRIRDIEEQSQSDELNRGCKPKTIENTGFIGILHSQFIQIYSQLDNAKLRYEITMSFPKNGERNSSISITTYKI